MALRTPQLPTTAAGAEICLLILVLGQRGLAVGQLLAALPAALELSPRPVLDAALALLFVLESVLVAILTTRRRAYDSPALGCLDISLGLLVLLSEVLVVPLDSRFTSWAGWAYPVSLGAAAAAAVAFRRRWQVLLAVLLLSTSYLAVTLLAAQTQEQSTTAITDVLSYPAFAFILRGVGGYLRRLGKEVDAANLDIARLATAAERKRHRLLLHDQASVLGMLSQPIDEVVAGPLRQQAALGAAKIRWFLATDDEHAQRSADTRSVEPKVTPLQLQAYLRDTCEGFSDLPLVLNLHLVLEGMSAQLCKSICEALTTLLHNVRRHAQASEVVVHVECLDAGWELTVHDNGRGFDPERTEEGYGLRHQVRDALVWAGAQVEVLSNEGSGTTVRMSGSRPR